MTPSWTERAARALFPGLLLAGAFMTPAASLSPEVRAEQTLQRAAEFFRQRLAVQGSYVWQYAADLSDRRGEAITTATQGWVQPPGTPSVGFAFLQAYLATGNAYFLDGAIEAANSLAMTQLLSGGWSAMIEFDPAQRKAWCYRVQGDCDGRELAKRNKDRNATLIDDDISQSALRLLMLIDCVLEQKNGQIHEAVTYGLSKFVEAQYVNGAWPFRFDRALPPEAAAEAARAEYPEDWPRTYVEIIDPLFYVTNDDVLRDLIQTFLLAHYLYDREDYLAAARRAGDFLLAAQMPAPQRGWAQTYDRNMRPIWGRKFEPPAVAARETRGAIEALLDLYLATGDGRYRQAASEAVAWLKASRLPNRQWARFYELKTNRPLFFTQSYALSYDDDDLPQHYSFKGTFGIPIVIQLHDSLAKHGSAAFRASAAETSVSAANRRLSRCLLPVVEEFASSLDMSGRWIEQGIIRSSTFVTRVGLLAEYLRSIRGGTPTQANLALPFASAVAHAMLVQSKC